MNCDIMLMQHVYTKAFSVGLRVMQLLCSKLCSKSSLLVNIDFGYKFGCKLKIFVAKPRLNVLIESSLVFLFSDLQMLCHSLYNRFLII